jgi:two-component system response regulator
MAASKRLWIMSGEPWALLVEDSASDRELTMLALNQRGMREIRTARDGAEALDLLFCRGDWEDRDPQDRPRVILLDVNMPRVGGFEVLREIKRHAALAQVPVVMLTSSAEQRDLSASYELGANSYVVKPVDIDEFFATLDRLGTYWLEVNQSGGELIR